MKIQEIRGKTDYELGHHVEKLRRELFDLRFKAATQGVQSPAAFVTLKRTIARVTTVLQERRLGVRGDSVR